jgi:hypothetical protein
MLYLGLYWLSEYAKQTQDTALGMSILIDTYPVESKSVYFFLDEIFMICTDFFRADIFSCIICQNISDRHTL